MGVMPVLDYITNGETCQQAGGLLTAEQMREYAEKKEDAKNKALGRYLRDVYYIYEDEQGNPLFRVVRKQFENGKKILQERCDENGNWKAGLRGVRRVIYRLPEVIKAVAENQKVFVVEGEKDVETLRSWGLVATTNPMGAGKWLDEYSQYLKYAHVVVLPDNDTVGMDHAEDVAEKLKDVAYSVKIVPIPVKEKHEDVTDWAEKYGGTKEKLLKLVDNTPEFNGTDKMIVIKLGKKPEKTIPAYAKRVCEKLNQKTLEKPGLNHIGKFYWKEDMYRRGVSMVCFDGFDRPRISALTKDELFNELCKVACSDKKSGVPPKEISNYIYNMSIEESVFKILSRIVRIPVFSSKGELINKAGYYETDRILYIPYNGSGVEVSKAPNEAERARARDIIENELLVDFNLKQPDKAHAIAYFLLFFCRDMINGPTPIHLFEAAKQGTGKTLLTETIMRTLTLNNYVIISKPESEDELRKKITTAAMYGVSAFCLDNIETLKSKLLAQILLTQQYTDRILGNNAQIDTTIRWVWSATGNNVSIDTDMMRRCIRIRLDCDVPDPHLRPVTCFKHPNLLYWCEQNRDWLVWAGLTLIQAWIAAGMPKNKSVNYGGFVDWAQTIGGILEFNGIEGFLGNVREFYDDANMDALAWNNLVARWWNDFKDRPILSGDLLQCQPEIDAIYLGRDDRPSSQKKYLSRFLKSKMDTVTQVEHEGKTLYLKLKKVKVVTEGVLWALKPVGGDLPIYVDEEKAPSNDAVQEDKSNDVSMVEMVEMVEKTTTKKIEIENENLHSNFQTAKNSTISTMSTINHVGVNSANEVLESTCPLAEMPRKIAGGIACIDLETTGLNPRKDAIRILSVGCGEDFWIIADPTDDMLETAVMAPRLVIGHNIKFDLAFIRNKIQKRIAPKVFDTMIAAQLIENGLHRKGTASFSLGEVVQRYLGTKIDKTLQNSNWGGYISKEQVRYCVNDIIYPQKLFVVQAKLLRKNGLEKAAELEFDCIPAIVEMELNGVGVDAQGIKKKIDELNSINTFDFDFNPASHQQTINKLKQLGINVENTSKESLMWIKHPLIDQILAFRDKTKKIQMLKNWDGFNEDGRIYPNFHQMGTATGRFSCSSPNLQQIPRDGELRKLFIPAEGYRLVDCDLSGIELRIMAWLSKDKTMIEALKAGQDLHCVTAAKVSGKKVSEITKGSQERQLAKAINFGLIYGMGARQFRNYAKNSYGVDLSLDEATKIREIFFETYPGIRRYHHAISNKERETYFLPGKTSKLFVIRCASGRARLFDKLLFTQAVNHPDQGTGADMIKEALRRLYAETNYKIILTVHDEILLEVTENEAQEAQQVLKNIMVESAEKFISPIPVDAEAGIGKTLAECK